MTDLHKPLIANIVQFLSLCRLLCRSYATVEILVTAFQRFCHQVEPSDAAFAAIPPVQRSAHFLSAASFAALLPGAEKTAPPLDSPSPATSPTLYLSPCRPGPAFWRASPGPRLLPCGAYSTTGKTARSSPATPLQP